MQELAPQWTMSFFCCDPSNIKPLLRWTQSERRLTWSSEGQEDDLCIASPETQRLKWAAGLSERDREEELRLIVVAVFRAFIAGARRGNVI